MSLPPSAAFLASADAEALGQAAESAITRALALIDTVKTGSLTGLAVLDAFDEAMAALGNTADPIDLVAVTSPVAATRDAADAAKQAIAKVRTDISLDRALYDALAALDLAADTASARSELASPAARSQQDTASARSELASPAARSQQDTASARSELARPSREREERACKPRSREQRDPARSQQDDATRHYLDTTLRDFRRAGVDRDEATRRRVRELQEELVGIGQDFDRNIRSDTRVAPLAPVALAGLPDDYVRAHPPGEDGLVRISTDYPDIIPFLTYATDASAREQLWRLFRLRGHPANVDVLRKMLERRHELATLLGYPSWAQYAAENKMVASEQNIADFIERIADAAKDRAARDYDRLLDRKRRDVPDAAAVLPWDASYLDDRVKAEQLAFDTQAMRPYFEYGRVKAGLMGLVERLFQVRFSARADLPGWHPDVECYDVLGSDGQVLGRIFLDMHPRADKYNHAAMFPLTTGKSGLRVPECALVCNLPRPNDEPALLQHSDVETFFHEFGHLIHHIFAGDSRWSGTSGIATEWDFVEAPSQLLEEWVRDAATLATFAVHHETGEPLPAEMVTKLRAAEEFGKGLYVRQQMFYAALSLELYRRDPAGLDPVAVERDAQQRFTPYRHVEGTYMHLGFGHLDGYSAIYCTYMWSLVIAKDLFTVFDRGGLLDATTAERYRRTVLAPGGSAPAADLVQSFLGRPYGFAAYQTWLDAD